VAISITPLLLAFISSVIYPCHVMARFGSVCGVSSCQLIMLPTPVLAYHAAASMLTLNAATQLLIRDTPTRGRTSIFAILGSKQGLGEEWVRVLGIMLD
jgi:hypothetical protein